MSFGNCLFRAGGGGGAGGDGGYGRYFPAQK